MQDQRWRGDAGKRVAHVGLARIALIIAQRHARRGRTVAGQIPPRAERVVAGDAGRDDAEHVEALVDGIRVDGDGREWVDGFDLVADRVVGRIQRAGAAVDDHQAAHPLGVFGGENDSCHRGEARGHDRRPLAPDGVHHRDDVLRPELRTDHVHRERATTGRSRAGRAGSPGRKTPTAGGTGTSTARRRSSRSGWTARAAGPGPSGHRRTPDRRCRSRRNWRTGSAGPRRSRHG